ncbi:MAG: hypothetical protein EHM54_08400, partial [Nitrospiraceae bacterium]
MHIVAIHNLPEKKEARSGALSGALGCTAYEALSRLRVPGSGPVVVAVSAEIGPAEELIKKLGAGGFNTLLLKEDEIGPRPAWFFVRKFRFGKDALIVESRKTGDLAVDYSNINLILRGTSIAQTTSTETVK